MICKKCSTAVDDKEKVCPNCGAKMNDNRKVIIISGVLVALVLVGLIYFGQTGGTGDSDTDIPLSEQENQNEDQSVGPDDSVLETPEGQPDFIASIEREPLDINEADLTKDIDDVWAMLDNTLDAVHEYYDKYSETVTFVSKNGYFYEVPSSAYVVVKDLLDLTGLQPEYSEESVLFFYLRPSDLRGHGDLKVSSAEELTIFVAYETKEGFAIMGKGEAGGIITREELNTVLEDYKWFNGLINRVAYDSDEFNEIIEVLTSYTGNTSGFDVRHLVRDDKYISGVVSPKDNVTSLNQFIMEEQNGVIGVHIRNLETLGNYRIAVNNLLPDFDLALLPDYTVADALKYIRDDDMSDMIEGMRTGDIITEDDLPLVFSNGTNDTRYLEFSSGIRFVGHFDENTWVMYEVESYDIAVELMWTLHRKPPLYILKQY